MILEDLRTVIKEQETVYFHWARWIPLVLPALFAVTWLLIGAVAGANLRPILSPSLTLAMAASLIGATGTWLLPAVRAAQAESETMQDFLDVADMISRWRPDATGPITDAANRIYERRSSATIDIASSRVSMRVMIFVTLLPILTSVASTFLAEPFQTWTLMVAWTCIIFGYTLLGLWMLLPWRKFSEPKSG